MNEPEEVDRHNEILSWPIDELISWALKIVEVPKVAEANSFVLHAPLELMARVELLAMVKVELRTTALSRIISLAFEYEAAGPSVKSPKGVSARSPAQLLSALLKAMSSSDLDSIDRCAVWLGLNQSTDEIRKLLSAFVAPSLSAAAHATIGLELVGRSPRIGGLILRGALREVGRHPDWRVNHAGIVKGDRPLVDVMLESPFLGPPTNTFIRPIVERGAGAARDLLIDASADPVEGPKALSRVAAWSMLQEPDRDVAYGWTHALTVPQSVISLGLDSELAIAVAATQLIGFRASLGTVRLATEMSFPVPGSDSWSALASVASAHRDAHFVKYTLACRDASDRDPDGAGLYFCAAQRLARWWSNHDKGLTN